MKSPHKTVHILKRKRVIALMIMSGVMLETTAHKLRTEHSWDVTLETLLAQVDDNFKVFFTITQISQKLKLFLRI